MENKRTSGWTVFGAVLLLLVVLLGLYVGGYFALGQPYRPAVTTWELEGGLGGGGRVGREYAYDWLAYGYRPLAEVEEAVTGKLVELCGPNLIYNTDGEAIEIDPQ